MGLKVLVYAPHTQHHCTWRSPWLWAACCLPKPQPGHLASLNRLMWDTETFGRVGEDGKEAKGTLLQTKSGDSLALGGRAWWQRECCLRDQRPWSFGAGAPWKGCSWGLSLLQHRERSERQGAACRSNYALAPRVFTTQQLTEGSGRDWTYYTEKMKGCWDRRGEQRCLPEAEPGWGGGKLFLQLFAELFKFFFSLTSEWIIRIFVLTVSN